MSYLNIFLRFLKGEHHTELIGDLLLLICVQILRQKLKTNLALMLPQGPVGVIGKTLVRY